MHVLFSLIAMVYSTAVLSEHGKCQTPSKTQTNRQANRQTPVIEFGAF